MQQRYHVTIITAGARRTRVFGFSDFVAFAIAWQLTRRKSDAGAAVSSFSPSDRSDGAPAFGSNLSAEKISSRYTSVAADDCELIREERALAEFECAGVDGWTVIRTISDLRDFLRLRKDGIELGPVPKPIGPFNETGDTLEWRGRMMDGEWRPFALIMRWFIDVSAAWPDRPDIQVLYVFRFDPERPLLCTAGYIEVANNPNPNEDARRLADQMRDASTCAQGLDHVPALDRPAS